MEPDLDTRLRQVKRMWVYGAALGWQAQPQEPVESLLPQVCPRDGELCEFSIDVTEPHGAQVTGKMLLPGLPVEWTE